MKISLLYKELKEIDKKNNKIPKSGQRRQFIEKSNFKRKLKKKKINASSSQENSYK